MCDVFRRNIGFNINFVGEQYHTSVYGALGKALVVGVM